MQVALLQGLTGAAADQAARALMSGLPSSDTSRAQQWIKQQANSLAAQTSLVHNLPESELMFLPDVMTRSAHQASPSTSVAAAGDRSGDGGGGPLQAAPGQADQQEASGAREQSAPPAASTAGKDQLLSNSGLIHSEPVSWLEWEQHLQVKFDCPASLAYARSEGPCLLYRMHCVVHPG